MCGADSTTVLRVWVGRPETMPSGLFDRVVVVCDVFDFGLEFVLYQITFCTIRSFTIGVKSK